MICFSTVGGQPPAAEKSGGGPAFKSELVSIHTFRIAFQFFEFGRGGAIAVTMMVINLILALIYLAVLRRQEVRR